MNEYERLRRQAIVLRDMYPPGTRVECLYMSDPWDVVGHFNGDEFYGLCQWCLRYTPSNFKGATIKEQCEYLRKTIESEFAAYGGNYNGITYQQFLKADTRTAAIAFERVYERCGDYAFEDARRADNAEKAYQKFHK